MHFNTYEINIHFPRFAEFGLISFFLDNTQFLVNPLFQGPWLSNSWLVSYEIERGHWQKEGNPATED